MTGSVGILNVGCGDTKLSFNKDDPAECIRAARIVKDMIRRGYVLLVKVSETPEGEKKYQRAKDFDENTCEYLIADFDPIVAACVDDDEAAALQDEGVIGDVERKPRRAGNRSKRLPASTTEAVAVPRTAGG